MSKAIPKRLGDLINLKRGYDLPESQRRPGPYPVISSAGITGYHDEYMVEGKGVVTGRYGTLGEMYYVDGKYWPHNTALYVTTFKGNDPKYIYYLLSCLGRIRTSDKSAVPGVNRNEMHEMAVPVIVDKNQQKKVAAVLSVIDAKIDCNDRINAELEAMAKVLYDYWFVQFDFPDGNGKPYKSSGGKMVYNATLKRDIPEGWVAKTLADLGGFKNGINYDPSVGGDSTAGIVNVRNISASTIFVDSNSLDALELSQSDINKYLVKRNSILIARSGIPGATRMMATYPPNTIYCGFIICFTVENIEDKLVVFFRLKQIEKSLISNSSGSILKNVSQDTLKEISLAMPSNNFQSIIQEFNTAVNPILEEVNFKQQESQELAKLRDWLLPLLMNGQVKVA